MILRFVLFLISASLPSVILFQLDEVLGDQPALKEKVFALLKQYAQERKVDRLAYTLPMILTEESQHSLIDSIR